VSLSRRGHSQELRLGVIGAALDGCRIAIELVECGCRLHDCIICAERDTLRRQLASAASIYERLFDLANSVCGNLQ
jgi:hypothetical protein